MQPETKLSISEKLRRKLAERGRVFVLTGAGVSAESGVPTFRGGGHTTVWKGMPFDLISSAGMLERDLPAVWEWFDYRRGLLAKLAPNPAHDALARWQARFAGLTLVTQNIDGLHQAAGSRDVIELHGNIWHARCTACQTRYSLRDKLNEQRTPACLECGGGLRPDVVLFGEMLPGLAIQRATEAARNCDLCFVVGTSAVVYPAASLPELARAAGAYTVEINPEPTPLTYLCDEVINGKAGEILPLL
jgi:NAD-dependent deacetylase